MLFSIKMKKHIQHGQYGKNAATHGIVAMAFHSHSHKIKAVDAAMALGE